MSKAVYAAAGVSIVLAVSSPASSAIVNKLAEKGKQELAGRIARVTNVTAKRLNNAAVKSAQAAGVALVAAAIAKGTSVGLNKKMESDKKKLSSKEYNERYNNETMQKIGKGYDKAADVYETVQKYTDVIQIGSSLLKKDEQGGKAQKQKEKEKDRKH